MTTWTSTLMPVALLTVLLLAPGLAIGWVARVRGLLLVALAPAIGAGVWAGASIAWGALGQTWSILAGVVVAVVVALVVWAVVAWLRPDPLPRTTASGGLATVLAWAVIPATLLATLLQLRRLTRAMGSPDAIAQSYDTVFHLNAVAFIVEGGNASPLAMTMANPEASGTFYPTLWHALVALATSTTGAAIPVATNALVLVVMGVVWPASVLALARVIFGPSPLHLGVAALLAFAFPAFPNRFLSFGVLYPNLLAHALLPAVLALVIAAVRGGGRLAWLAPLGLAGLGTLGLGCAHPNGAIGLLVLAAFPLGWRLVRWTRDSWRHRGSRALPAVGIAWAVTGGLVGVLIAADRLLPMLAAMRQQVSWDTQLNRSEALADVLSLATPNAVMVGQPVSSGFPAPILAALVLIGVIVALRTPALRWLPFAYATTAVLWVVAVSWRHPWREFLTGYWYGDQIRVAGLLPILGIPLAVLGVVGVVRLARVERWAWRTRLAAVLAITAAGVVFMGWMPATRQSFERVTWMHGTWPEQSEPDLISPRNSPSSMRSLRKFPTAMRWSPTPGMAAPCCGPWMTSTSSTPRSEWRWMSRGA